MLTIEWSIKLGRKANHPVDMVQMWVKVMAKRNDVNMHNASDFLKEEA